MAVFPKVARVRYMGILPKIAWHLTQLGLALIHENNTTRHDKYDVYASLTEDKGID